MQPNKVLTHLMQPLLDRNIELATETPEQRIERLKIKYDLSHGTGKRKQKQNNKKKNKKR